MSFCKSAPLRNLQSLHHRRPSHKRRQGTRNMREICKSNKITCALEADEITHPREGGDVGDAVVAFACSHDPRTCGEALVKHA